MMLKNKISRTYYSDVGKHKILTAAEERRLLERYKFCQCCKKSIPPFEDLRKCVKCGKTIKKNKRVRVCQSCGGNLEISLAIACPFCGAARDLVAREEIIKANLRFAVKLANKYAKNWALGDLISAANIGLITALEKFDARRQTRLLTYAGSWIKKEIMEVINQSPLVHIPTYKQKEMRRIQREKSGETADLCKIVMYEGNMPQKEVAYDEVERLCIDSWGAKHLRAAIRKLDIPVRDKFIVFHCFGVPQEERRCEPKNLVKVSCITGITPERVRQIKERSVEMLQKSLTAMREGV